MMKNLFTGSTRRKAKTLLLGVAMAVGVLLNATCALAASFADKPIRLIVPAAAGGATDVIGRLVAQKLSESLGQPVVVENIAGASSMLGTRVVARAPADGHTLLLIAVNHAINATLFEDKLAYDSLKDFTFISQLVSVPNVLLVNSDVPAKSVAELIAYGKQNPKKLTFGSSGAGTSQHLSGELFRIHSGLSYPHVPYKGAAPAMNDLLGGHISLMFDSISTASSHLQTGKIRALAVTSAKRNPLMPDLPSIAETLPGYDVTSWFGIAGPRGMPAAVVTELSAKLGEVTALPEVRAKLTAMGAEVSSSNGPAFAKYMADEVGKWKAVIKGSNIKVD